MHELVKLVYTYSAYGLGIRSELCIPQFQQSFGPVDISIRLSERSPSTLTTVEHPVYLDIGRTVTTLAIRGVGQFVVHEGREVEIVPESATEEGEVCLYLSGIVTGLLLYQRGLVVLHASSVMVGGVAVAFIGPVGAGKSSLAAALYARGCPILADDNTALVLDGCCVRAIPGFPQLKVDVSTGSSLGYRKDELLSLHASETKRGIRAGDGFPSSALPLKCIYALSTDDVEATSPEGVERLSARDSLLELVRNSIPTRLRCPDEPAHFLQCVQLAQRVPVYRLQRRQDVRSLPQLAAFVEKHVQSVT